MERQYSSVTSGDLGEVECDRLKPNLWTLGTDPTRGHLGVIAYSTTTTRSTEISIELDRLRQR